MYLSNNELYYEIIVSKATGSLTRKSQKMLELLAKKTIKKMRYYNPDDRFDCYQSGILDMFDNWQSFNEEKSKNPFAYFTEIFKRGIAKGLNQIHNRRGIKDGDSIKVYSIDSLNDGSGMHNI